MWSIFKGDAASAAAVAEETEEKQELADHANTAFGGGETFIHGEITRLGKDAVDALHARFQQDIQDAVTPFLPAECGDDLRQAAKDYAIALVRTRQKLNKKNLQPAIESGAASLKDKTKEMLHELDSLTAELQKQLEGKTAGSGYDSYHYKENEALQAQKEATMQATKEKIEALFDGSERVYFKLSDYSSSPLEPYVLEFLESKGYAMQDYAAGYAVDTRKNTVKIGKILKDNPALLKAFTEDPYRSADNLTVVMTRSYEDLARASYGRGWQSCRSGSYSAVSNAISEIDTGVIAAYLISDKDPDIHNPLGRINLKPYDEIDPAAQQGWLDKTFSKNELKPVLQTIYMSFNPIGLHHPGFVDAVNRFAEEHFNHGKAGEFRLRQGCESYQEFRQRTRLPEDTEEMLKAVNAKYKKHWDGSFTVKGDLVLKGLGLSRLPDLSNVKVEGGIDVSNNKLLTLEGLPQTPVKWLDASFNLLICFKGAPPVVHETFNYQDNAYLQTTYGKPQAKTYKYGNGRRDPSRHGESHECIGPLEKPANFPGFKRT